MKRVAFICQNGQEHFLINLCNRLSDYFEIKLFLVNSEAEISEAVKFGDVLWFEWADKVAAYASTLPIVRHKKTLIRLHSYEALTKLPNDINWLAIDRLLFVSRHVREVLKHTFPLIDINVQTEIIPNGVDVNKFKFRERERGYDIAWIGNISHKKNLPLALQIMCRLVDINPKYKLHIAGHMQEFRQDVYSKYFVHNAGLDKNVIFDGYVKDIDSWLEDKNYLLHTSLFESFGYAIAEAMAKGIKPIIHEHYGAYDLWPNDLLFFTLLQAVTEITSNVYDSRRYRQHIENNYHIDAQVEKTRKLLNEL